MKLLGFVLVILGVCFGVYMGIWWALIGGIVQFIDAVRAPALVPLDIALSIARVLCCGVIGSLCAWLGVIPGYAMLTTR